MPVDLVGALVGWVVSLVGDAGIRLLQRSPDERALSKAMDLAIEKVVEQADSSQEALRQGLRECFSVPPRVRLDASASVGEGLRAAIAAQVAQLDDIVHGDTGQPFYQVVPVDRVWLANQVTAAILTALHQVMAKGGLAGLVHVVDIEEVLKELAALREQVSQSALLRYEVVGALAAAVAIPVTAGSEPSSWGFVGRDQELAALLALLDPVTSAGVAVSAVSGMAGVGKTALAWRAAQTAVERGWFPGGAVFVDLHGYDPDPASQVLPERMYASLLRALDPGMRVEDMPGTVDERASAYHRLMSRLGQMAQPVLLVLDNVGTTDQLTGLLPTGRAHRVLVTSRHTMGELPGARVLEVNVLAPDLAVELLASALGARRAGAQRLSSDPGSAAELVRLCGYLPLALQIIGALMADEPSRPLVELVEGLADETSRLQGLSYERWSVRTTFELSYRRLDDDLARLFRLMALAPGPDIGAQAAAALVDRPVVPVRQALATLTRAHLVERRHPGRWRMHDLIHLYAAEQASTHTQHDDQNQAMDRLLSYYRDTTRAADRRLFARPGQHLPDDFSTAAGARDWLQVERANLVTAVAQAAASPAHHDHAFDIALNLSKFLDRERHLDDWTATATTAVRAATALDDRRSQAMALNNLGLALRQVRRYEEAITSHQQAADIYRELGDRPGEGTALNNLGLVLTEVRRFDEAIASHQQAVNIFTELGDRHREGGALGGLGVALGEVRRFDEAITSHQQNLAICRELGDRPGEGIALNNLGVVLVEVRRLEEAITSHQQDLAIRRELGDRHLEGRALNNLGLVLRQVRRYEEAITSHQQAADIYRELGDHHGEGKVLNNLGLVLRQVRRFEEAITSHQQAADIYRELGDRHREGTALHNLGNALQEVSRFEDAIFSYHHAVDIFTKLGDRHRQGQALTALGCALREVRRFEEAITSHRQAVDIYREFDDRHGEGMALTHLGSALHQVRRYEEAITSHQQAVDIYREFDDRHSEGMALTNLGSALQQVGRFKEAIASHQQAVDIFTKLCDRHRQGQALTNLGLALRRGRRLGDTRAVWEQALALFVALRAADDADRLRRLLERL